MLPNLPKAPTLWNTALTRYHRLSSQNIKNCEQERSVSSINSSALIIRSLERFRRVSITSDLIWRRHDDNFPVTFIFTSVFHRWIAEVKSQISLLIMSEWYNDGSCWNRCFVQRSLEMHTFQVGFQVHQQNTSGVSDNGYLQTVTTVFSKDSKP